MRVRCGCRLRQAHRQPAVAARLIRRSLASASATESFDSWLSANPLLQGSGPADAGCTRSDRSEPAGHDRQSSTNDGVAHAFVPCGKTRRFHWRQAPAEAVHPSCALVPGDGRPLHAKAGWLPRSSIACPAAWPPDARQQQQGVISASEPAAAQPLLLKLPPSLWEAEQLPQGRFHDLISWASRGIRVMPGVPGRICLYNRALQIGEPALHRLHLLGSDTNYGL